MAKTAASRLGISQSEYIAMIVRTYCEKTGVAAIVVGTAPTTTEVSNGSR